MVLSEILRVLVFAPIGVLLDHRFDQRLLFGRDDAWRAPAMWLGLDVFGLPESALESLHTCFTHVETARELLGRELLLLPCLDDAPTQVFGEGSGHALPDQSRSHGATFGSIRAKPAL